MASDWTLALEQTSELRITRGSLAEIAGAVKRGADLRLYMTTPAYEEALYFQQTYAGEGHSFAGLMTHHHSYTHRGSIADQAYFSFFRYDVFGSFSQIKWMPDNRTFDETQTHPYGIYRWFVCDRWRLVYEHDDHGNRVSGSLEELKECIREGRTMQVGIRQLFGLAADDPSGPEHISFLTTMQPLIQDGHVLSNCDFVLVCAPKWPFVFRDGLHLGIMQPSTSGEIACYLTEIGKLHFKRSVPRRAMQWRVAEKV